MMTSILFLFSLTHANEMNAKLVNPETFCKIEEFGPQRGKPKSADYKKCDRLKDKEEVKVAGLLECKQRALAKGEECLRLSKAKEIGAGGKFIERFAVSFNSTSFSCGLSQGAANVCP